MINNGLPPTLGAGAKARSAEPCERLLAASMGGRAAWPTVRLPCGAEGAERGRAAWPRPRRHLADKELTRSRLDVRQKRYELRPIASAKFSGKKIWRGFQDEVITYFAQHPEVAL